MNKFLRFRDLLVIIYIIKLRELIKKIIIIKIILRIIKYYRRN